MSDGSTTQAKAPASTWSLLRRFWSFAVPHRRWIFGGLAMIPLVAGLTTIRPLLLKEAIDGPLSPPGDLVTLRLLGIAFLVAVMAEFLCSAVQVYALQRGGHATISDVRRQVFAHVLRLPARFYDNNSIGGLLSRTTSDVEALSETLAFGVFTILTDVVMIGSILVAMFVLDPVLTLITLTVAPVLYVLVRYFGGELRRLQLEMRKASAAQTGFLAEQLSGVTLVQLFGRERAAIAEYARLGQRNLDATKRANWFDALLFSLMDGISAFTIALMIYFAAPSVTGGGAITLGLLFAFVDYLQRVFGPIKEFSGKLATIQRASASLDRIYGLLDEPAEAPASGPDALATWKGGIRVRDLKFRYKDDGPDVLRGISFDVAPGEVIAVVGRTGSGKSSLGRILTRFYDGYRGEVALVTDNGPVELSTVAPERLRHHVLMVQQDVFLFNDTVAYNVSLGDPELTADRERLARALALVQADQAIADRGGLDMEVGERGANLSAGEAQLVAFARVAARQPKVLILDEATASVDSITEQQVQRAIETLLRGRSVIVIAHRLSTIRRADRIIVLRQGEIAEIGRHDELLARGGLYAELVASGLDDAPPAGDDAPAREDAGRDEVSSVDASPPDAAPSTSASE